MRQRVQPRLDAANGLDEQARCALLVQADEALERAKDLHNEAESDYLLK